MADMTPTQGRYLAFVRAYTEGFGLPPAESEIAQALGVSPPSVNQMMKTLERKGLIRRTPGAPRSIEILVPTDALPQWKGSRISRTVWEWRIVSRPASRRATASANESAVYQFKIELRDTKPLIWRRIETHDVTLAQFHELIQIVMGWTNSHLHLFELQADDTPIPDSWETAQMAGRRSIRVNCESAIW